MAAEEITLVESNDPRLFPVYEPGKLYLKEEVILHSGKLLYAAAEFTAPEAFNSSQWIEGANPAEPEKEKVTAPTVTNPGAETGVVSSPTELQINATNAEAYAATGLPTGLTINTLTGRISGTPTAAAAYTVNITVIGPGGTAVTSFTWTISAAPAPTVTKPANQTGTVSAAVTPLQIEATNTIKYAASGLPTGLSINETNGVISGTPTTAEAPTVTITVENAEKATKTTTFTWTISAAVVGPQIRTTGTDPESEVAVAKSTELKAPTPREGTQASDLLLLIVSVEGEESTSRTITTPEGWTLVGASHGELASGTAPVTLYVFQRVYEGVTMPTLKASGGCKNITARVMSISNAGSIDVASAWSNQTSASTTNTVPTVTTITTNDLLLALVANPNGHPYTTPAGWATTNYSAKTRPKPFTKLQSAAGAVGTTTVTDSGGSDVQASILIAVSTPAAVTGITDKLSSDKKAVEPVTLPSGTAKIRVGFATAESGQEENTEYSAVEPGTTRIEGVFSHPWVMLQALNSKNEPIGEWTPRLKTIPELKAPVVNKPPNQAGHASQATTLTVTASESPTGWTATGLPPGLSIGATTGIISGTPTTPGSYTIKVIATNTAGSGSVEFPWVVEAAVVVTLQTGIALNSDETSTQTVAAIALGAAVVRSSFGISTAASTIRERAEFMKGKATLDQPMATFTGTLPTAAQAKALKAWAEEMTKVSPAPKFIEFGNETSYGYQYGEGSGEWYNSTPYKERAKTYALRAKEACEALVGTGVKLLIQGDDGGSGAKTWIDEIFATWPGITTHAAFGGWVVHAYPNSKVETEKDTSGVGKMERLVKFTEAHGDTASGIYNTEWGAPSTNAGTTMASGQSMTWAEAAKLLELHKTALEKAAKGRLRQLLLYQAHDQQAEGGTEREWYFGILTSSGGSKGAFTTFAKTFL